MVTLIEILILAVIQGITEWLPISSTGHLRIAESYLRLSLPVFFDVVLHVGSLLVVLLVFWQDIAKILKAIAHRDFKSENGRIALYVVVGSVPTAVIGFVFKDLIESLFDNLLAIGVALIITGSFLFVSERQKNQNKSLNYLDSILMGVAQGVALIPGISRSGITITTGLLRKVDRQAVFKFSFLLFIPAVVGATALTAVEAKSLVVADIDYADMLLGLATTVVVGYVSLKLLWKIVLKGRFHLFAYYCWSLGIVVVLLQALTAF